MEATRWHIELSLTEDGRTTTADAVLRTSAGTEVRHSGTARRNPEDRDVPQIGEELAVCRALTGLAHDLLEVSMADVEENVHADPRVQA